MLTALRDEVNRVLADIPINRRPAVKRCGAPDALLATSLPFTADADAVEVFTRRMTGLGWRVTPSNGWLLLDRDVIAPESTVPETLMGECGCCISLLLRHPGENAPCQSQIRAVVKAADEGPAAVERTCTHLHADLAERLRLHEPLPGQLLPYLLYAHESQRRNRP